MDNEALDKHLYKYPDSNTLRNKLNIKNHDRLNEAEVIYVSRRIQGGIPEGNFDLKHLKDIHKHLFQDIYEWAGEIRQVNIGKGNTLFMPHDRIGFGMQDIHKRLKNQNFLKDFSKFNFSKEAGVIIGDVNHLHPFREGNGRTQFQYLKQLGSNAGLNIDLSRFRRPEWIKASIEADRGDYNLMSECIYDAITGRTKEHNWDMNR